MERRVKNLPIIIKILSILGLFGLFTIATAFYTTGKMQDIASGFEGVVHSQIKATISLVEANKRFSAIQADIGLGQVSNTPATDQSALNSIHSDLKLFDERMTDSAALWPAHAPEVTALKSRVDTIVSTTCASAIQMGAVATSLADNVSAQTVFLRDCAPSFPPIEKAMVEERRIMAAGSDGDMAALTSSASTTILLTFAMIIGGLVLILVGSFFAVRIWVTSPLIMLQSTMERLSSGDLSAKVLDGERKDEIGGMARAVQHFRDAGLEKLRLAQEAKVLAERVEAERARSQAAEAHAAAQQKFVVDSVAEGLEKLTQGNLLFRLTDEFSAEYEKLRSDFNAAMENLQDTMKTISANTEGVRSGVGEITQASDDLSRRTEQQAASLEETAAALDEITATVRRAAERAAEARNVATAAKTDAEHSGSVVNDAVKAMSGIETSSGQISNIIGVIDEIAFQTNLLALNAGVEAARAGDAGRGFAVVATEVRALAQRSADAAKEIKALISTSGAQVNTGVKLVGETGKALARIVEHITRLNTLVVDIAASAEEQATGLNQVNAAVNQMDQVTQQNAAMVEESTAASHGLAGEAESLSNLMRQFQIGQAAPAALVRKSGTAKRASPRPPTGKFVAVARPAQMAASSADDWDEF
jgi:methyl-accepting chemotaxis protein